LHEGDLEPGAQSKYAVTGKLLKAIERNEMHDIERAKCYIKVIDFLDLQPRAHKHVVKDMCRAYMAMCPFFPNLETFSLKAFYDSEDGSKFKDSDLLNSELRAQHVPDRRIHHSNRYMPLELFSEWYRIPGESNGVEVIDFDEEAMSLPAEWQSFVRPLIAKCKFSE
jgi:hypothetical protein